jgi:hypothetical protein
MMVDEDALARRELLHTLANSGYDADRFMPWIDGSTRFHIPFHDVAGTYATGL